ncbi:MAG: hypothetical protein KME28_27170 [Pelatocladus maniniholoensis HA4357-MV3]|jgi:hypothetical protein|uniref:Uncharacterized protein n=1 Tax=Pelatocladus maniniholoensis HA4357-MV3 TaxID=1117104 RepID=A0A9E3HFC4_9NOST|nr:hypothetical protein [Pelatocladus maniniholoensis HA4357-MV3]
MSELSQTLDCYKIQKGIHLLGLNVSESELKELLSGNSISLESRDLSEIGLLFILAEALSALISFKKVTFRDLSEVITEDLSSPGIPIFYWNLEVGRCCLYLALVNSQPALKICYQRF